MKKNLVLLISISLFTACKNDKGGKDKIARDKDDYRSSDKDTKNPDKEKTSTDYNDDKNNTENSDKPVDKEQQPDYTASSGWPKSERASFITSCEREAVAAGQTRLIAESYCQCMLDKIEALYPDITVAAKLTKEEIESFGKRNRDECLREH